MKIYSPALYDWHAWHSGNLIQKWWKHSIAHAVWDITGNGSKVLDIGCGSSPLIGYYDDATGVDTDKQKIAFMQRTYPHLKFWHCDGDDLPFESRLFDHVLIIEVIEHVERPAKMLQEAIRVLKDSGNLIIATPNYGSFIWLAVEKLYGIVMKDGYESDHYNAYNKRGIIRLCEHHGLQCRQVRQVALCDLVMEFTKVEPAY